METTPGMARRYRGNSSAGITPALLYSHQNRRSARRYQ